MKTKTNSRLASIPEARIALIVFIAIVATFNWFASTVQAQLIVDPDVVSYSSAFANRVPQNLVSGPGLTAGPSGILGAADTTAGNDVDYMWYSNPFLTPPDYNPYVIFDLGGTFDLQTTRIWQFNQSPYAFTVYGAADIEVLYSTDGTNFTPTPTDFYPNRAGGTNGEPAQDFSTPVTGIRYMEIQIFSTFGGQAATGLSGVRFLVASNTAPPVITSQPQNQTVPNGGTASFIVTAIGPGPISYQWTFNGTNLTNGVNISGATTSNLVVSASSSATVGSYAVVLTNPNGTEQSWPAGLVLGSPIFIRQPTNVVVLAGQTATLTAAGADFTTNTANVSYQWIENGTNILTDGGNISGSTSPNLVFSNATTNNDGYYNVLITDKNIGTTNLSKTASLTVAIVPGVSLSFVKQPILDPTVVSFSSAYSIRSATNLVNSADLSVGPSGILGADDTTAGNDPNNMWYSDPFLTPPDTSPYVVLDLGGLYNLSTTRIWQYNQPGGFTVYGAADIVLSFSADGTNYTSLPDIFPNQAGGTTNEPAQDFSTPVSGVRFVNVHILSSFGGAQATGLSGIRFVSSDTKVTSSLQNGVAGLHYQMEYNANINSPNSWQLLQDIPSLSISPFAIPDPTSAGSQPRRFYRSVLVLP